MNLVSSVLTPYLSHGECGASGSACTSRPEKAELRFEQNGITYYNVSLAALDKGSALEIHDSLFPESEQGYYIENETFLLSAKAFNSVIKKPFSGNGAIKYCNWRRINYTEGDTLLFDGVLPVSRMNDPLYVSMCAPSEGKDYLSFYHNQINGDTNVNTQKHHMNVTPLGAIYLNLDCNLPSSTKFTLCVSKITCCLKYVGEEWHIASCAMPDLGFLYPLPWQLHYDEANPISHLNVKDRINNCGDYCEIPISVGDFKSGMDTDSRMLGRVFHFWGDFTFFDNDGKTGADVEGIACGYKVWIKEEGFDGILTADTGADLRTAPGAAVASQSFSTKTYLITHEPRFVVGHNVVPEIYGTVMHTEKVQQLLGMK